MFEHAIIQLLKEFSPSELNRLEKFIKSPYHNKSRKIVNIFMEIKKYHPDFQSSKLTKENLALKANPDKDYNDSTFRDLISDLHKCIEEFMTIEELNKNETEKLFLLIRSYSKKKQDRYFNNKIKNILSHLETGGLDSIYFYNRGLVDMYKYNYRILNKYERSVKEIEENKDIKISYMINIYIYFVSELINIYLNILIVDSKYKNKNKKKNTILVLKDIDMAFITELLKDRDEKYFILDLYSNLLSAFNNLCSQKHYIDYKTCFFKYQNHLSRDEISFHNSMLISFCILSNAIDSKKNYDPELFEIYKNFLSNNLFFDRKSDHIDIDLYRNILFLAIRLREFKWALNFIKTYSNFLHTSIKENTINLSLAEYYYHIGSDNDSREVMEKAFDYLPKIHEDSFMLKYDIRDLYLKLYFDLNYYDQMIIYIENYRKFLKRNNLVTGEIKRRVNNFLKILNKLVFISEGSSKSSISSLRKEITDAKDLKHRDWLLKKIDETETSKKSITRKTPDKHLLKKINQSFK